MTANEVLKVDLKNRGYNIVIGNNILENKDIISNIMPQKKAFIVTDENVAKYHLENLQNNLLRNNIEFDKYILPAGEKTKSFEYLIKLQNSIFAFNPERKTTIIALGGGVIGDLAGFTASILLRGINYIQIPTTLLSQVDSSVGGKTGINNKFGKNLIGSFYQPKLVIADLNALKTLDQRQYVSGYAEVVKYGLINNEKFFNWLDQNVDGIKSHNNEILKKAIFTSCQTKAQIVAEDEKEHGKRALLNLGHTLGHAIETITDYSDKIFHGEAVAIGTIFAFKLSEKLGFTNSKETNRVYNHYKKIGLPTDLQNIKYDWNAENILSIMFKDKKVSNGKLTFILANKIGDTFIQKDIDQKTVFDTINEFLKPN